MLDAALKQSREKVLVLLGTNYSYMQSKYYIPHPISELSVRVSKGYTGLWNLVIQVMISNSDMKVLIYPQAMYQAWPKGSKQ